MEMDNSPSQTIRFQFFRYIGSSACNHFIKRYLAYQPYKSYLKRQDSNFQADVKFTKIFIVASCTTCIVFWRLCAIMHIAFSFNNDAF